ncbi:S24 family peptidase [Clostridium psychrophilum]|uniref:S24 family peptidase n=1 Tax=Clostridium psychrophilum TaxID=132926 RepID=UPI001C0CF8D4|nr:S24 family peptidase [Clostridium psychrophilum]MBU3180932.1 repressor LexA [Clostridium psychrophilum]
MELSMQQEKIIHDKPLRYSLIKGNEGTGKTTVAIYRSLYLENNYCLYQEDKILMLASKDEDINHIKTTYNRAKEETRLDYLTLFSNKERKLHVVTLKTILHTYFMKYKSKYKLNDEIILDKIKKESIMKECILEIKSIYPKLRILHTDYAGFFVEEVKWMKSCDYLNLEFYLQVNRTGRRCGKGKGPQKILKNSSARKAIFELMLTYNKKLRLKNLIDTEDMNVYALKMAKIIVDDKYSHIIIDKTNNLTKIQLDFVNAIFKQKAYSSMMFIVDVDRAHNTNSWMVKGKRVNARPLGEKVKSYIFKSNYKTQEKIVTKNKNIVNEKLDVNGLENFKYCDIRHNRAYDFMRDYSRVSDIIVNDEKGDYEYLNEELLEIPVFSDIAAGEPILINSEIEGNFYIPKFWLRGVKNPFILKVKGDSMIGANINHGDYVIIRQEQTANNNDIVAVDIGGNATLKRLSISKDKILLMPANENYQPIVVDSEDTFIIGTAVGIIKHKK